MAVPAAAAAAAAAVAVAQLLSTQFE